METLEGYLHVAQSSLRLARNLLGLSREKTGQQNSIHIYLHPVINTQAQPTMKSTTLLTALLSANLALGAKWTQKRRESREARRASSSSPTSSSFSDLARTHSSSPIKHVDGPPMNLKHEGMLTNNTFLAYSENWAGAALVSSDFTSVTGTIVVPTPTSAQDGQESAGAAVSFALFWSIIPPSLTQPP